jgi:3-isopropylmalate dehydrogenase
MYQLLVLAGDGIGPEIMPEVKKIANWFIAQGLPIKIDEELYGLAAWSAHGTLMPAATWAKILAADAILFGATSAADYAGIPASEKKHDYLLKMRRDLDLFTNLRPIRLIPGMEDASTLRPEALRGTDMIIVRELTGGLYFGEPRGIERAADGSGRGFNTLVYTTHEVQRIARAAFDLARTRSGRVCNVDKSNVLETYRFWRDTLVDLHRREYPDIALTHMFVDNCAMQLVRRPSQFDVIVTENLFGDILSDCAAMVAGSLGMLPSASLSARDASGKRHALYEPIHGSAPDIAGRDIANPCGAILSFGLCLEYTVGRPEEAKRLQAAVERVIAAGVRTADIAVPGVKAVSTAQMGDAILSALESAA